MSNYIAKNKHILIVLAPFIAGWLFYLLMYSIPFSGMLLWTLNIGFVLFWFWGGRQFAKLSMNKVYSYLLGNSLWLLSLLLFLWQSVALDGASQNLAIAGLSQYYMLLMLMIGTQIHLTYAVEIDPVEITLISYAVMLVVFTIGFIYQTVKGKNSSSK
ncbi:hypothetical protein [Paenibacillus dakarensis]|uniref:hypothetical protein n=1 Tax=Paenibacillus dakarensis TaxID=1527293 RepID=UPI0006D5AE67|nr:hypothetical protein [Paenibacillus dakarensis]